MGDGSGHFESAGPTTVRRHRAEVAGRTLILEGPYDPDDLVRRAVAQGQREPAYWAHLWPTALQMAQFVAMTPLIGPETSILEVGCGLGLIGLTASLRTPDVLLTDLNAAAVAYAATNARLNGLTCRTRQFDWFDDPDPSWRIDLLLASDVLYDATNHRAIARLIGSLQCTAIIGDPNRPQADGVATLFESVELRTWTVATPGGRLFIVGV